MNKELLRTQMKARYAEVDLTLYVKQTLEELQKKPFPPQGNILAYAPDARYEIPFVKDYMELLSSVSFFLPKIDGQRLVFYSVKNFSTLKSGRYGLLEPKTQSKWSPAPDEHAVAFVPAIAATERGVRLGRGGGYYDRFLKESQEYISKTVCVLPDFAVLENIPQEPHDVDVDVVLGIKS